jgi:DNA (cytosine-5)-methyltransferase 1
MKPRLLDLFCCAGGAGMGYHRAGFEVVGVDIEPQPRYPFEFHRADALEYLREHSHEFDVIHASPPCQAFTKYKNVRRDLPQKYPDLIDPTRKALIQSGKTWILENVVGAPVSGMIMLCGSMFGLDIRRHRLFESDVMMMTPPCNHSIWEPNRFPGGRSRERGNARVLCRGTVEIGRWNIPLDIQQKAMGMDWTELHELSEAIPPAYTEYIGKQLLQALQVQS